MSWPHQHIFVTKIKSLCQLEAVIQLVPVIEVMTAISNILNRYKKIPRGESFAPDCYIISST